MKRYSDDILKKLQRTELEIYNDFAKFCDENNINYYATYGTVLGAVRHKGFIPWDDDMDVGMLREDYEKFLKLTKNGMGDKYDVLSIENTDGYVMTFAKVIKKGTTFVEATDTDRTYHSGIFIDIFPSDNTVMDEKIRSKQIRKTFMWARICVLTTYKTPKLPKGMTGWKKKVAHFGCTCIYYFLKICNMNKLWAYKHYMKHATKYNNEDTGIFMDLALMYSPDRLLVKKENAFPLTELEFEDSTIKVFKEPKIYLENLYGDYMKLPPEEDRHDHFAAVLDFGDGSEIFYGK